MQLRRYEPNIKATVHCLEVSNLIIISLIRSDVNELPICSRLVIGRICLGYREGLYSPTNFKNIVVVQIWKQKLTLLTGDTPYLRKSSTGSHLRS
jgi:hypothetical protein